MRLLQYFNNINRKMQNSNNRISLNFSKQMLLREPILAENFLVDFQGKENQQNNSLVQLFDEQLHIQFKNFHKIIALNFNLRFQIIYTKKKLKNRISKEVPFGFLLFNGSQVLRMTRYFQGDQIQVWKKQFAKKIIQRGFSDDYKLLKKLKQRNYWIHSIIQNQYSHKKFMCKGITKNNFEELKTKTQLQNQIKVWRKLNHYNLLKLYEVRQTQHSIYLIYEMVEQKCLAKRISQKTFNILQIQLIIKSILQGLVLLHSKGIIHRNISPEAIFFRKNKDFQCLIGNFQDCCQIQDQSQVCNQVHGTTGYIAPEIFPQDQSKQFQYTFASDMFSVGAILYQLLLEKPLFHGLSKEQKMMQNVSGFMDIKLSDFLSPKHDIYFTTKKEGFSLICKLLTGDPNDRLSALEALNHPFFNSDNSNNQKSINKRNSQDIETSKSMLQSRRYLNRNSENIEINKSMLQSRRYLNRNSENIPKPKMTKVQSCQLIESDEQKMDLYHKMVFYHLAKVPKFLSS